jgi:hypothetical protein
MTTLTITNTFDVITKYASLIAESLGTDSVYIRTKETLDSLLATGGLTSSDKARVVSEVLNGMNSSLVNAAMNTALQWAKSEKDNEYTAEELGYKLDVLAQEILMDQQKVKQLAAQVMIETAQSMRMNGTPTVDPVTGYTTALSNEGKIYKDTQLIDQQIINAQAEFNVINAKVRESQASVYKIVADTHANFGDASYTLTDASCAAIMNIGNGTLAYEQQQIAKQQAKGYAYNAWANAVNAAATTVGMLISENTDPAAAASLLNQLQNGVNQLVTVPVPV